MKIALVVPHIFMHPAVLSRVIFSPGYLALDLAQGLQALGDDVTLFAPGKVADDIPTVTPDMTYFEQELAARGDSFIGLLKKHPFTFVTLARQVQSGLIAEAFAQANAGQFDVVHIYCNEEDIALPFAQLCQKPVVFTHHDPFNFLVKYRSVFPKYKHLPWLSMSLAQRVGMPPGTNWLANIYHGLPPDRLTPIEKPADNYIAYAGRIIQPKGLHLAIAAMQQYNKKHPGKPLRLKIAGKHYGDGQKDAYWREHIEPQLSDLIEYVGFISSDDEKRRFLGNARAVIVPSIFDEPFGMVVIEALACGTPVIGLDSGAIPEIIKPGQNGFLVAKQYTMTSGQQRQSAKQLDEGKTAALLANALQNITTINRKTCRQDFEERFTLERMAISHHTAYQQLITGQHQP